MKLNQLSLFLENQPGRLSEPCKILAEAGINILTISLADTQQFGILRLIVQDWKTARDRLEKSGYVVKITNVVAIEMEDQAGGLESVLEAIDVLALNVEYMYAFTYRKENKAIIVFSFEDIDLAIDQLKNKGIKVLESEELFQRIEQG